MVSYSYLPSSDLIAGHDYLDPVTRITNHASRIAYEPRRDLIEAVMGTNSFAYQYDPIGNRELTRINANTNRYSANELNQYQSVESESSVVSFSYDDDGNLVA